MLWYNGIVDVPFTAKNLQANAICECMHQTVGNSLRAMMGVHPLEGLQQAIDIIDTAWLMQLMLLAQQYNSLSIFHQEH